MRPYESGSAYALLDDYRGKHPEKELAALVALIRRVCGIDKTLSPYTETVRRNFQTWIMTRHSGSGEKFNDQQMAWLRMIRDHVATSFHLDRDDLEMAPFDAQGGLGRMYRLFGATRWTAVIDELNERCWPDDARRAKEPAFARVISSVDDRINDFGDIFELSYGKSLPKRDADSYKW